MTFPAARLTDQCIHGGMITMGHPTTLINALPAARIGDMHMCPMFTGLVPHVGGPIILGAFTVLVGGMPLARMSDMVICVGPPDTIAKGEPTVVAGAMGAAGFGGLLAGLGMAMQAVLGRLMNTDGFPRVEINPLTGTQTTVYNRAITIEGTPEFQRKVLDRLATISRTESGTTMLGRIDSSGRSMTVIEYTGDNSFCGPKNGMGDPDAYPKGFQVDSATVGTGKGADATLQLNPDLELPNDNPGAPPMPNDAVMFHEMTHGTHIMSGEMDTTPVGSGWDNAEEKNTIQDGSPSEADYLRERGYGYHRVDHATTFVPDEPADEPAQP